MNYGLLLDVFGNVFSYGRNSNGQLGLGAKYEEGIE